LRHTAALTSESDVTGHSDIKLIDAEKKSASMRGAGGQTEFGMTG
jgi:hypothetical protein